MLTFLSMVLVAVSTGIDGMVLGWTYGLRNIQLFIPTYIVVGIFAGLSFGISIFAGEHWIIQWVNPEWTVRIGSLILIGMGIFNFRSSVSNQDSHDNKQVQSESSRTWQALQLGLLLSLDSAATGTAASFMDFPVLTAILLMAVCSPMMLAIGLWMGKKGIFSYTAKYAGRTAGIVLFLFGCSKWLFH